VADVKGQLLLTLNGIFVTIVSGALLGKPDEVRGRLQEFGWETWLLMASTIACVFLSILCATMCLRSRLRDAAVRKMVRRFGVDPTQEKTYKAGVAWWFGTIAVLEPRYITALLKKADSDFEREALASDIVLLSHNVLEKHRWVNKAWLLSAASLMLLLGAGMSYALRSSV
jgi:hypothetical protein